VNQTEQIIAEEVRAAGAISFARFMELALYCPVFGYYETEKDTIGRRGDYFTSVSVGSLFGELLAFQFAEWLAEEVRSAECDPASSLRSPGTTQIVEAGAHGGELANDILQWLSQRRPALFQRLEYWIVEPSGKRQEWQRQTLDQFISKVHWVKSLPELSVSCDAPRAARHASHLTPFVPRVLFCNELLDAMPVHRLGWDARRRVWFEWGVALQNGRFVWMRLPEVGRPETADRRQNREPEGRQAVDRPVDQASSSDTFHLPAASMTLSAVLPDGFTTEVCPAAEEWWRQAAGMPGHRKLVAIDYGLAAEEFLVPQRKDGTLRAYHRHRIVPDVLANAGEQDLTAHINFSAIREAGEAAGLRTECCLSQERFLTQIAAKAWDGGGAFGEWSHERTRQFQTLTHPEHLGRAFRVLVQSVTD
jgi:SAM-dependent MidA family methyltransferase